jgi:hypothetical protein
VKRVLRSAAVVALTALVATARAGEVRWTGIASVETRWYPREEAAGRDLEWGPQAGLEIAWAISRNARAQINPHIHWDPLDGGRWRAIPTEAWVETRSGRVRARVGRQTVAFGSALLFNPADVAATRDWGLDFLDPPRPGDWAGVLAYGTSGWGFEIAALPVLEGAPLPGARSPWSFEAAARRQTGFDFEVTVLDEPRLPRGTSEVSGTGRVRVTHGSLDLYLTGYSGVDRVPVFLVSVADLLVDPRVRAEAVYLPLHLIGVEVQTVTGGAVLHAAAAYRDQSTDDARIRREVFEGSGLSPRSVQVALGGDYLLEGGVLGEGTLDLGMEVTFDDGARGDELAFYRPLQRDLAVTAAFLLGDLPDTRVEAAWVQDLERDESVASLRAARRIGSGLRLEVGGEVVRAPADTGSPLALYRANDRLVTRLSLVF